MNSFSGLFIATLKVFLPCDTRFLLRQFHSYRFDRKKLDWILVCVKPTAILAQAAAVFKAGWRISGWSCKNRSSLSSPSLRKKWVWNLWPGNSKLKNWKNKNNSRKNWNKLTSSKMKLFKKQSWQKLPLWVHYSFIITLFSERLFNLKEFILCCHFEQR